ncbi:hypothetical protein LRB48_03815 [Borreliella burgdorferi]|uniref:hypothetical protein n=3 Tax=Borreliella burgdorferi TaxID=139 RepID=UPI00017F2A40|nr:hypothetical protein [Borreliella burgdorferi]MCD2374270.1 hypothetical protein [Borreliella burgdorferi]MCD2383570.1 hypothetical protein [Borreliella burgdorferi]MCD2384914.1 hypothetical protein [Borreliella burgdorferi]MCD2389832.1 hypothetical protein [Borreliella burgdorferi]MCD2393430.1 hypothetical protein [Borreliella burgdorferi]
MKKKFNFIFPFIIFLFSCNISVSSIFIRPLDEVIKSEIALYESLGDGKFKTGIHAKNYFDSIKDISYYSYFFILDKFSNNITMKLTLSSKKANLLTYDFGIFFDRKFKLEIVNLNSNEPEFSGIDSFDKKISFKNRINGNIQNFATIIFNLDDIRAINREFELKNDIEDLNSSTNEFIYFLDSSKNLDLRESYITVYYYVLKAIEKFLQ